MPHFIQFFEDVQGLLFFREIPSVEGFTKGVSAKTHKFKTNGDEAEMDYNRLFTIIKKSGFTGYVGIEYEGGLMRTMGKDESYPLNDEGVMATKKLLEKVGKAWFIANTQIAAFNKAAILGFEINILRLLYIILPIIFRILPRMIGK